MEYGKVTLSLDLSEAIEPLICVACRCRAC